MIRKSLLTIVGLLVLGGISQAQTNGVVSGVVVNATDNQPVIYASVFSTASGKGSVTNQDGYFELTSLSANDSIGISFIGFKTKYWKVSEAERIHVFRLEEQTELLATVHVLGDNSMLYRLVSDCKKQRHFQTREAKVYYSLGSYMEGKRVELVESYFNGKFFDHDLAELDIKNGRLGLGVFDNSLFISSEISKAIRMHKLFEESDLFPDNPLHLSRRQLERKYDLSLLSKYRENDEDLTYCIGFQPKAQEQSMFEGKVWIDSLSNRIIKVELECENATRHPFAPFGHLEQIDSVDLYLGRTFRLVEGVPVTEKMDFKYTIDYSSKQGSSYRVDSEAIFYAFDFDEVFLQPFFHFSEGMYEDYRRINAIPYNPVFWNKAREFGMSDQKGENEKFLLEEAVLNSQSAFQPTAYIKTGLLEHQYTHWNGDRITLRDTETDPDLLDVHKSLPPSQRYNLNVQLFMDVTITDDTTLVATSTIFDPFDTYFDYPIDNRALAFINIYFDLVEIERRKIVAEMDTSDKSREEWSKLYDSYLRRIESLSDDYFREVDRGNNEKALQKWNDLVVSKLQIDNLSLFPLPE